MEYKPRFVLRQSLFKGGQYPFFTCAEYPDTIDSFAFDDDVVLVAGNNANGNFHVSRFKGKFNAYQRTYVLTAAKSGNSIDYIYYALKLELKRLREKSQGSQTKFLTMPIITGIHLQDLDFDEQSAIAKVLSTIDAKIELNNRINADLEAMAKTLYDYWFVQFDFPFDFSQSKSDANGKPYKTSGGKMVYNPTLKREIPEGWTDGTLEDLGQIVGGSTPTTTETYNFCKNGTPWITPNDLSDNQGKKFITSWATDVSEAGIKSASLKKYPKGTVLLSSRAPIGYMAIRKAKADCFFENTFPAAIKFADYEQDLLTNLKALLDSLQTDNGFAANKNYLGEFRLSCYGARLKRIRNDELLDKHAPKPFHICSIGSFTPYFQPYQKWRNDGLNAIRGELEKDRNEK